jgi:hypothetical protein
MSFKQFMQPRQRNQFQVMGEFLYVEACNDKVLLQTERGEYRLQQGAQIIDDNLSGLVTIENLGEAGNVEILYGFGRYVPPSDGQTVTVSQMPAVKVSELPAVEVSTLPAVKVSELPAVKVSTLPAVKVSELPAVEVSALPPVIVSELPKVKFETGQTVNVYAVTALLTKPVGGDVTDFTLLTVSDGIAVLANDLTRCEITIKASINNVEPIILGGVWELFAGEVLNIKSTAELNFTGVDGDKIQIMEIKK